MSLCYLKRGLFMIENQIKIKATNIIDDKFSLNYYRFFDYNGEYSGKLCYRFYKKMSLREENLILFKYLNEMGKAIKNTQERYK